MRTLFSQMLITTCNKYYINNRRNLNFDDSEIKFVKDSIEKRWKSAIRKQIALKLKRKNVFERFQK